MTMQVLIVDEWPRAAELDQVLKELGVEVTRQHLGLDAASAAPVKIVTDGGNFSAAALIAMTSTAAPDFSTTWPNRSRRPYLKRKKGRS